jgi:hypothetical protein
MLRLAAGAVGAPLLCNGKPVEAAPKSSQTADELAGAPEFSIGGFRLAMRFDDVREFAVATPAEVAAAGAKPVDFNGVASITWLPPGLHYEVWLVVAPGGPETEAKGDWQTVVRYHCPDCGYRGAVCGSGPTVPFLNSTRCPSCERYSLVVQEPAKERQR